MLRILRTLRGNFPLAVGGAILCLAAGAWGAEPPGDEGFEIPAVVIGATRLPDVGIDLRRFPGNVTVVTAEDIKAKGARTVPEALLDVPGLTTFYDVTGNVFQQTIDLRGFNGDPVGVTVLVDGARVNEAGLNQVTWEAIPLDDIERIEILPGPGGAIVGRNALSGIINIVTKRGAGRIAAFGEVAGGSFGRFRPRASLGGSLPYGFDFQGGYTRDQDDGWRDDSGGRVNQAYGKLGWRYKDATDVALTYNYTQSRIRQAGSLTVFELNTDPRQNPTCCDINPSNLGLWVLNGRQQLPWGFSLAVNGFERSLASSSRVTGRTSVSNLTGQSDQWGGTVQVGHESAPFGWRNVLTFGVDYQRNETDSLLIGNFPSFLATTSDDQGLQEDMVGFFGQDVLDITRYATLTFGLRYDRDMQHLTDRGGSLISPFGFAATPNRSGFARTERLLPRAGITVRPTDWSTLYFSFAEAYRPPTTNEILGTGAQFLGGGIGLDPVLSRNLEVGGRVKVAPWAEASLALYNTEVRNEIFPVVVGVDAFGFPQTQNQNIPKTRRRGAELGIKGWWRPWADGFVTYSLADATFESTFPLASPSGVGVVNVRPGDRIPLVPQHRLNLGVNVHPLSWLTLSANTHWVSDTVPALDPYNIAGRQAGYWVTNAAIRALYKGLTAFINFNNVFNQQYETFSVLANFQGANQVFRVPGMPFNVFGGVSYRYELPSWVTGSMSQGNERQGTDR
jgi:iron complex outermembrane receptor protein